MGKLERRERCQATARHGGRCRRPALPGNTLCAAHLKTHPPVLDTERCVVVSKWTGERCRFPAAPGDTVCHLHKAWERWNGEEGEEDAGGETTIH